MKRTATALSIFATTIVALATVAGCATTKTSEPAQTTAPPTIGQTVSANDPLPEDPLWKIAAGYPPDSIFRNGNAVCVVGRAKDKDPEAGRENAEFVAKVALVAALSMSFDELDKLPHQSDWWYHTDFRTHDFLNCVSMVAPEPNEPVAPNEVALK